MRMNLNKPPKKDGWFKKLLVGGVVPFVLAVGALLWLLPDCGALWSGNETCDNKCRSAGYPAGEILPPTKWKHRVCVCWPGKPSPPTYFLLERDD
jgi:hypothetical protein